MDKTVPAPAALLLDFIRKTEVGTPGAAGYDVIFGNRQGALAKPVTRMTLAEVQAAQKTWATKTWAKRFGSTAASSATGAYQFMKATLADLILELKLNRSQILDADLQDRLGFHLLKRRGYELYMAGSIGRVEFAKRLAQEWASFPVLAACQGAHRKLKRGQSFYAGDGLNKALVTPEAIEALLDGVDRIQISRPPAEKPAPAPAKPSPAPKPPAQPSLPLPGKETAPAAKPKAGGVAAAIVALVLGAAAALAAWLTHGGN